MSPKLMRKYLDIINEQTAQPSQEFINQLDTAYRTGGGPGAEVMSGLSRDQQAMMLRNQGAWVNRDRAVQQGENPGARVYNPNQQDIDSREAGIQASLDRVKDPKERAEKLAHIQSRDINKPYFTTTKPTATDTKEKPAPAQPAAQPAPRPTTTIEPEVQARVPLGGKSGLYGGVAYDYAGGTAPGNPKAQVGWQGDYGGRVSIARSLDPNMPGSTEVRGSYPLSQNLTATGAYKQTDVGAKQAQLGLDYNLGKGSKLSGTYQQNVAGGPTDPRLGVTFSKSF